MVQRLEIVSWVPIRVLSARPGCIEALSNSPQGGLGQGVTKKRPRFPPKAVGPTG